MRKLLLVASLALSLSGLHAQTHPAKPAKQGDKPPTQKEMDEMMKELQKEMDNMDPEQKRMMDSMGIKMPNMKNIQKKLGSIDQRQLNEEWENQSRIVPKKDEARIAQIPSPLTTATVPAYLQYLNTALSNHLDAKTKNAGEKIVTAVNEKYHDAGVLGNTGAGFWVAGKPTVAIYVSGKAAAANPSDADNINNFSAMLTMAGGEQFALPMLTYLNKQYPLNSTILNNIAMAWFGLGDMVNAGKYADSTLRFAAIHPQANIIKAKIAQSEGKTAEAAAYVKKAMQDAYSQDKEDLLRQLGDKPDGKTLNWDLPFNEDFLGLETWKHPEIPSSVDMCIGMKTEWEQFFNKLNEEIARLGPQERAAQEASVADQNSRNKISIAVVNAKMDGNNVALPAVVPFYANKASLKVQSMMNGQDGLLAKRDKAAKALAEYMQKQAPLEKKYDAAIVKLTKEDNEQTGEGKPNKDYCPYKKDAANTFLGALNPGQQQYLDEYLKTERNILNTMEYYNQYILWPAQYELTTIAAKRGWLEMLGRIRFKSIDQYTCTPAKAGKAGELGKFEDGKCNYKSRLNFIVFTIDNACDKMETRLNVDFLDIKLKQDFGDNKSTFSDQFESCSVKIGYKKGVSMGNGPLRVEAKVGIAGFVEVGRSGITDAGVIVSANVKAGTNLVKHQSGTSTVYDAGKNADKENIGGPVKDIGGSIAGVEAKISINSGLSVEGKGILKGMKR